MSTGPTKRLREFSLPGQKTQIPDVGDVSQGDTAEWQEACSVTALYFRTGGSFIQAVFQFILVNIIGTIESRCDRSTGEHLRRPKEGVRENSAGGDVPALQPAPALQSPISLVFEFRLPVPQWSLGGMGQTWRDTTETGLFPVSPRTFPGHLKPHSRDGTPCCSVSLVRASGPTGNFTVPPGEQRSRNCASP
ncbi:hypothetical protein AAFF_G00114510 [Aldrovandia affinis]|uniref:Uncharacterized protein n=1 Tax=Aldrovandia affinis TaxID=143900 RepID=A0AAD7WAS9_9TELE|nr:hypothetical protein AAFF_G00114510 [Aldrovandia affinis]